MRRPPIISLDPMKFAQAFAAGLRVEFADAACAPVPEHLAASYFPLEIRNPLRKLKVPR